MKKNLDITKPRYSEQILSVLGPSLNRGSTVIKATTVMYCLPINRVNLKIHYKQSHGVFKGSL